MDEKDHRPNEVRLGRDWLFAKVAHAVLLEVGGAPDQPILFLIGFRTKDHRLTARFISSAQKSQTQDIPSSDRTPQNISLGVCLSDLVFC